MSLAGSWKTQHYAERTVDLSPSDCHCATPAGCCWTLTVTYRLRGTQHFVPHVHDPPGCSLDEVHELPLCAPLAPWLRVNYSS